MDFFDAGKVIKAIISAIPKQQLPKDFISKVWPVQAISGTETYPFCVYRRISGRCANLNKDGFSDGYVNIMLTVVTENYNTALINTIASALVNYTELNYPANSPISMVDDIQLIDSYEDFSQDGFLQTIRLEIIFK